MGKMNKTQAKGVVENSLYEAIENFDDYPYEGEYCKDKVFEIEEGEYFARVSVRLCVRTWIDKGDYWTPPYQNVQKTYSVIWATIFDEDEEVVYDGELSITDEIER